MIRRLPNVSTAGLEHSRGCMIPISWRAPLSTEGLIDPFSLFALFEFGSFLRSSSCISLAIRMGSGSRELSAFYDQILVSHRLIVEPTFQYFPHAGSVPRLSCKRSSGCMWCHSMVWHCSPRMVLRCRLRKPNVPCITCQLTSLQSFCDCIAVTDFSTCALNT